MRSLNKSTIRLAILATILIAAAPGTGIAATAAPAAVRGRSVTPLDAGWRFLRDDVPRASDPAFDDASWVAVTLPHTFNGGDGDDGGGYYRGPAWYRRTLTLARIPSGRRMWLQFDGAALASDIWINGRHLARHEGGYAAFRVDATAALRPGANVIAVRTDNSRLPQIAPLGGDFTVFGGLYRHVWLVEVPDMHVDLADHGGPGLYIATTALDDRAASLGARVLLRNDGARSHATQLSLSVRDASGTQVATATRRLTVAAGATATATVPLTIAAPRRWNGRADPYLYAVTAKVDDQDSVTEPLGLRTAAFDPQRGFLLNGRPYPLHGVDLFHSGRPGRGLAVTDNEVEADLQTLDELGATGVRFVHFQHPPRAYDEADRRGMAVWTEIGLNGAIDPGAPFAANITEQMRELIRQNYNHPSVVLWGLGNEVYTTDPAVTRTLRTVQAVAHAEDPSRPTIYAHCCQADDNEKAGVSDVIGFNRYFGWYPGQRGSIGSWADGYHAAHPGRAFVVSEYGAGASIRQQQIPPPAQNVPESGWHPEQAQTLYHQRNWQELSTRPYLGGAFVWVAFDLASDGRHEGDRPGINDKGLVSYDRAVRKDAFYWYQANWSGVPMIHLLDRRLDRRTATNVDVAAFTNAPAATLSVNGRVVGSVAAVDHMLRWPAVPLQAGVNDLVATATGGTGPTRDAIRLLSVPASAAGASAIPDVTSAAALPAARPANAPPGQEK